MSPANKTRAFLAAIIAVCLGWEGYGLAGHAALISPVITDAWTHYPLVIALSFLLIGHWVGGRGTDSKDEH